MPAARSGHAAGAPPGFDGRAGRDSGAAAARAARAALEAPSPAAPSVHRLHPSDAETWRRAPAADASSRGRAEPAPAAAPRQVSATENPRAAGGGGGGAADRAWGPARSARPGPGPAGQALVLDGPSPGANPGVFVAPGEVVPPSAAPRVRVRNLTPHHEPSNPPARVRNLAAPLERPSAPAEPPRPRVRRLSPPQDPQNPPPAPGSTARGAANAQQAARDGALEAVVAKTAVRAAPAVVPREAGPASAAPAAPPPKAAVPGPKPDAAEKPSVPGQPPVGEEVLSLPRVGVSSAGAPPSAQALAPEPSRDLTPPLGNDPSGFMAHLRQSTSPTLVPPPVTQPHIVPEGGLFYSETPPMPAPLATGRPARLAQQPPPPATANGNLSDASSEARDGPFLDYMKGMTSYEQLQHQSYVEKQKLSRQARGEPARASSTPPSTTPLTWDFSGRALARPEFQPALNGHSQPVRNPILKTEAWISWSG